MNIVCRKDLVQRIKSKNPTVKCYDINAVVNTLFDEMADALQNHEKVIIRNILCNRGQRANISHT